ncbi:MAG: LysM peptidoglycan-binding domain-containing protein [Anaerolineae bacterium]|nr:LysM peptidoglycan-binding domain-containing protein [Anaerolineae bacterium]
MNDSTASQHGYYDLFKLVVAAILVVVIVILLVRWNANRFPALPPTGTPTSTPTSQVAVLPTQATATPVPTPIPTVAAPALTLPQGKFKTGEQVLSGTGTPGSEIQIWVDGEMIGVATVDANGRWTLPVTFDAPGEHSIQAQIVDKDGNVLATGTLVRLDIDPAFAPLAVNAPEPGTFSTNADGQATGMLNVSGRGEPGAIIQIWAGDQLLGTTVADQDGNWAFDQQVSLAPGENTLFVQMNDADGGMLARSEPIAVDIQARPYAAQPTLILRAGEGELSLGGAGAPGAVIEIVANGQVLDQVTVGSDGRWDYTAQLAPGDYQLYARAVDTDGTVLAESEIVSYTQPKPQAIMPGIESPVEGAALSSGVLELQGTGEPGGQIEILDNDVVVGAATVGADGRWSFPYQIDPGAHALAVQNAQDSTSLSRAIRVNVTDSTAATATPTPEPTPQATATPTPTPEPTPQATATPAPTTCSGDPPYGIDRGDTYVVARCEYMVLIAQRTGVRLGDLLAANPQVIDPAIIFPGQVLNLPPR